MKKCLAKLGEREQYIIQKRMLTEEPMTLEEIGKEFGVSRERVRQIEARAFATLSSLVKKQLVKDTL